MKGTFHPFSLLNKCLENWRGGTSWFGFPCGRMKKNKHVFVFKKEKLRCVSADYQAANCCSWIIGHHSVSQWVEVSLCFPKRESRILICPLLALPPLLLTGVKTKQMETCILLLMST